MRLASVLVVAGLAAACSSGSRSPSTVSEPGPAPAKPAAPPPAPPPRQMTLAQSGIVPDWIDNTADPCTDFYEFACGGFLKTATIPPDRSSWSAIEIVVKEAEDFLHQVLEDAAKAPAGDPTMVKLGGYYAACMDEAAIERAGTAPMQPMLDAIARVTDAKTAAAALTALHRETVFALFSISPGQDFGDATQVIANLDQAGLGLPDREYYFEAKGRMASTRAIYLAHLGRLFQLLGRNEKQAKAAAADTLAVETKLAQLQQDKVVRRDPHAVYHRVALGGLETKIAPRFPWRDYLTALGIPSVTAISVNDPKYYTGVTALLATNP